MSYLFTEERPWGGFTVLNIRPFCKVKEVVVFPGKRLSYQFHARRSEHWVIIKGTATIIINDEKTYAREGESVDIPVGAKHRIGNDAADDLIFIEVQQGDYFEEDDIVRLEDDYERVPKRNIPKLQEKQT